MYHPQVLALDQAATEFHEQGLMQAKNIALRLAGRYQQHLFKNSPYDKSVRFLNAQWVWALGHIGLLHQLIRWFKHREPETILILECQGAANPYFLEQLRPYLKIVDKFPEVIADAVQHNAVYFGCPDGEHDLADFYKLIEKECEGEWLVTLTEEQKLKAQEYLLQLGIIRPYIALQPRKISYDAKRNVTEDEVKDALSKYPKHSVVITGLDETQLPYPSVHSLDNPHLASFLLSAFCDTFVGSDSGAWVIPHAYQRPVELMNDHAKSAWIYP